MTEARTCPGHACTNAITDDYLCRACQRRAERILGDLPALTRELETTVTRQDRIASGGKRGKGHDQPAVANLSASDRGRRELELLFEWADAVAAWHRVKGLPLFARSLPLTQLVPAAVAILLRYSDWMRTHPDGADLASAIWYVRQGVRRIIDVREERLYAGPCHEPISADAGDLCRLPLYRKWGADDIVCDGYEPGGPVVGLPRPEGCGHAHPAADRHAFLVASVEEYLLPLKLVWESLYVLIPGCEIAWKTAQQWTRAQRTRDDTGDRVRIRVTPPRLQASGVDWRGQPLYRGGDILRLAQDKRPRRGRRRVQRADVA